MKKITILLLSLLILLCGCGKEATPTEPPVQETEEIIEVTGPEAILDPEDMTEPLPTEFVLRTTCGAIYNEKGEEILNFEYSYDPYGRMVEFWEYEDGNVSSFSSTVYISDAEYETTYTYGELQYSVRFTCDENGRVIHQERTEDGAITSTTSYTYDDRGNMLTMVMVYTEGTTIDMSYIYTYDDAGNPVRMEEYNAGELAGWQEETFDSEGRTTEICYYDVAGELIRRTVTTYDGNTRTDISYDMDGTAYMTRIMVTDDHGNTLSQETWQEDVMVSRTEYTIEEIEIIVD